MKALAPRTSRQDLSMVLDNCISGAAGVGLTHWFVRVVPLANIMVDKSVLAIHVLIGEYMIATGVLFAHIMNTVFLSANKDKRDQTIPAQTVERYVLGSKEHTYDVRPLASVIYIKLGLLTSIHFFVEGFNIGCAGHGELGQYLSPLTDQIFMAIVMGIMGLRTGCGIWKTFKLALLYSASTPLGVMCGLVADDSAGWMSYMTLATIVSLMAGFYLVIFMQNIALPEVDQTSVGKSNRKLFFLAAIVYLACLYPFSDQ
ncbi:hypothetical protein HPB48_011268 [Haemaphysalis longicornis]|uniref:Uncharacterized protein n=1 Tax=Haemaphysalis longicornis TaxID=44386 RepID=A0A9J6G4D5_HAELO|nr:hypothetical protein HPB48_011268 [Haemaphysalis longicornis]